MIYSSQLYKIGWTAIVCSHPLCKNFKILCFWFPSNFVFEEFGSKFFKSAQQMPENMLLCTFKRDFKYKYLFQVFFGELLFLNGKSFTLSQPPFNDTAIKKITFFRLPLKSGNYKARLRSDTFYGFPQTITNVLA